MAAMPILVPGPAAHDFPPWRPLVGLQLGATSRAPEPPRGGAVPWPPRAPQESRGPARLGVRVAGGMSSPNRSSWGGGGHAGGGGSGGSEGAGEARNTGIARSWVPGTESKQPAQSLAAPKKGDTRGGVFQRAQKRCRTWPGERRSKDPTRVQHEAFAGR